jgi:hypothetical protein
VRDTVAVACCSHIPLIDLFSAHSIMAFTMWPTCSQN